jgi:arylsulfatase A-like enzyme
MAPTDTWKLRLLGAVAGGTVGCVALGVLDVAVLLARVLFEPAPGDVFRLVSAGALAGAPAGALAGLLVSPVALWARARRPRSRVVAAVLCACASVAGCLIDAFVYTHLYREAHLWAGVLALLAAALAGALLFPTRAAAVGATVAVGLAVSSSWVGPQALGDRQRLWHTLQVDATVAGRIARLLWEEPSRPAPSTSCRRREPTAAPASGGAQGMNVLLVEVDAMRGDLGGERLSDTLPSITARLDGGFRFDRAYAAATYSIWSDTASLRGRWPHRIVFTPTAIDEADRFQPLPENHPLLLDPSTWRQRPKLPVSDRTPTLGEIFARDAAYRTIAVVPWVFFLQASGIAGGFEVFDDAPYQERNRDNRGVTSDLMTDRALAQALDVPTGTPWLMWLHYMDPHEPYLPFGDVQADAPAWDRYLGEIRRVDHEVGRLLDGLEERDLLSRTVVVVWSDHGEEFRDHGGLFHGTSVYEEQARVPMIIRVPGLRGRTVDDVVSLVDLAPTLVDLLGVRSDVAFNGRSLMPLLRGEEWTPEPVLAFSSGQPPSVAVIVEEGGERSKLIDKLESGTVQLFDLVADPRELRNLADERPQDVSRLRCLLQVEGALDLGGARRAAP